MIIAVCIDDKGGMLFNNRRQSRDRTQQEDLLSLCGGKPLWIAPFSEKLLSWAADRVTADGDFLQKAGPGEVCFVEDHSPREAADRVEAVVLYRWNRTYPADLLFDLDLSAFQLTEQVEFSGSSHEKITRERYERSV